MTYLAIDLGDKRVGIAVSREKIAFPHSVVMRTKLISEIKKILDQEDIKKIVVGLPYDLYGKDTRQLDKTQIFIEKLRTIFIDIEIVGHDERFSSFVADEGTGEHSDDVAAQNILQSYIDSNN